MSSVFRLALMIVTGAAVLSCGAPPTPAPTTNAPAPAPVEPAPGIADAGPAPGAASDAGIARDVAADDPEAERRGLGKDGLPPESPAVAEYEAMRRQRAGAAPGDRGPNLCPADVSIPECSSESEAPSDGQGSNPPHDKLSREEVYCGMHAVAAAVRSCFEGGGRHGTITVGVTIEPDGCITDALALGEFAGTPAGLCAARAVSGARFPATDSSLMLIFPFRF